MPKLIFTCAGYHFWRDSFAFWNVTKEGDLNPPSHCAYSTPDAIARLKNVSLSGMVWNVLPD